MIAEASGQEALLEGNEIRDGTLEERSLADVKTKARIVEGEMT